MAEHKSYMKRNKFNAKTQSYGGRTYHSMKEANYAMELDWRIKAGEVKEWIPQYKLDLRVNGEHIANYYIDFKVVLSDETVELHEVKGFETDVWRLKWRITQAILHEIEPGAKLVLIK